VREDNYKRRIRRKNFVKERKRRLLKEFILIKKLKEERRRP